MKNNNKPNSKYYNNKQIDSICNVLTDAYTEKKLEEGKVITQIDIDDFVVNVLGCTIVYENIASDQMDDAIEDADCMGFSSDGIQELPVIRDGKLEWVLFPKDTIVIDNYLKTPKMSNKRRFTIAHEAGHIIKNRMSGQVCAEFNHVGGVVLTSTTAMRKRYSFHEVEANNFAASLLMPECMVAMLMHKYYGGKSIVKYADDILDGEDVKKIYFMSQILGVSYEAMYYRLKHLGYVIDGELATYIEDNVIGNNEDE